MSELLHFIQDREAAFKSQNRLASLYSDFSAQKTLNPSGYAANLSAWKKALFHACRKGRIPAVAASSQQSSTKRRKIAHGEDEEGNATDYLSFSTGEELARALELRPYGRPTGLAEVIKDSVERRELIPITEYLNAQESIYSKRWIPTPWEVVRWGLRSLGLGVLYGQQDNFTVGRFVVVENVELAAQEVLELQRSLESGPTSGIYSLRTFTEAFERILGEGSVLSASDVQVLLRFMSRDKPTLSYDAASGTIKFAPSETTKPVPVDANDMSIAQVKTLALSLQLAIPPLEKRYTELDARVRDAVAKKQNSAAKSFLKARKMIESTLEQRRANLLQVEESLHAIENAANNAAMVEAMQESTKVMKDLNQRVGGVEGVERVTDAMRDEMETTEEINRVIAEPGMDSAAMVDESEVDEEFEALVAAEKAKEDAAKAEVEAEKAREEAAKLEGQKKVEEAAKLKRLEEEEMKEKVRRLEEWKKFQATAQEAEERKQAEEQAAKDDLEKRFAELSKPIESAGHEESPTTKALSESTDRVKEMTLDEQKSDRSVKESEQEKREEPMLAS